VRRARRWALPSDGPLLEGGGEKGGYAPTELRAAYRIPSSAPTPSGLTVAIVDAYGDNSAESDLAHYRERYGLPACTKANGCFRRVNYNGEEANYPPAETEVSGSQEKELVKGWEGETSLDLDMASAGCSQCHIMLVQGRSASTAELGGGDNLAVSLGAKVVSNSYGVAEELCGSSHCESYAADYNHPGVVIVASAGDRGYDNHYENHEASPSFPATVPDVIAVGGTSLRKSANARGWVEEVWNETPRELGTGSGCSLSEAKPSWQADRGCTKRTGNDVAAVGSCETPVSAYSSAYGGWEDFCGTSASSPLVAGIMAHASEHIRSLGPRAFYEDTGNVFAVTAGANGSCAPEYLCNAAKSEAGYNGPAGLGTPDGVPVSRPAVTAVAPATGSTAGGTAVTITGTGFAEVSTVKFGSVAATGFTVQSETEIAAVAPAGSGTVGVRVTNGAGESAAVEADRFSYVAPAKSPPQLYINGFVKPLIPTCSREVETCNESERHTVRTEYVPTVAWGPLTLRPEGVGTSGIACTAAFTGKVWNEREGAGKTGPERAYAETVGFNASDCSAPGLLEGYEGTGAGPLSVFVTAEPPLQQKLVEGAVCNAVRVYKSIGECPASELQFTELVASVTRPPSTLPWKSEFVRGKSADGQSVIQQRIGMASYGECGPGELEATSQDPLDCRAREANSACYPAGGRSSNVPTGCVDLDVVIPQIPVEIPVYGSLEATWRNGVGTGISPSSLEFEGSWTGRLASQEQTEQSQTVSGSAVMLGAEGQELLTLK
jgi:hypothetical protein